MTASASEPNDLDDIAAEALSLLQRGGSDANIGAKSIYRHLGKALVRRWKVHYRIPESEAEELLNETVFKLCQSRFDKRTRAIVWINIVARSVALEAIARKNVEKRGGRGAGVTSDAEGPGRTEINVDDEVWMMLGETVASDDLPAWVRLCVHKALHVFTREQPKRTEVLALVFDGYSAAEVAIHFGATPPPTAKEETAARNRVLDVRKVARQYFAHCKDEP